VIRRLYELINVVVALCPNFCLIGTFRGIAFQFRESVHLDLRLYREVFVCSPIMWSGSPSARKLLRAIEAWALGRMLRRVHTVTQHRLALDTDAHGKRFSSFFLFYFFLFSFCFAHGKRASIYTLIGVGSFGAKFGKATDGTVSKLWA